MRGRIHWRSLLIVGLLALAVGTTSEVAAGAADKVKPAARLTGVWVMSGTYVPGQNAEIFNVVAGPIDGTRSWTFKPKCKKGACSTVLTREMGDGGTQVIQLAYKGKGRYVGTGSTLTQVALTCDTPPIEVQGGWVATPAFTVKVTKTKSKNGVLVATGITAAIAFSWDETPEVDAISGCTSPLVEYEIDYTGVPK